MKRDIYLFLLCLFISFNSYAFKFSPMSTSVGTKEKTNSTLFYLENDSDQPIAVTASVLKREMSVEGVETNKKISNEFTVYPTQLIIPPNEKRSVKVTWAGKTALEKEEAYRLVAEQLPIELDKNKKKKASIKVLLRYVAALYVEPEGLSSEVELKKLEVDDKDVILTIENKGKKHQVLADLTLKFSGKKDIVLEGDELKGMTGENILAQSERIFRFPKAGKFKDIQATDKVKINFDKD